MRWFARLLALLLLMGASLATPAFAQVPSEEIETLPAELSLEQIQTLQQLSPVPASQQPSTRVRRRLPVPIFPLTPEELSYRETVRKLGVKKHRFVHCELTNGKVLTGVITTIRDDAFWLKDGIFDEQLIPYTDLRTTPRPVAAVGTRIAHGFEWVGLGVGVAALMPLIVPSFILMAAGCAIGGC